MRETVIKQGPGLSGLVAAWAAYMLIRTPEVKFLSFFVVILRRPYVTSYRPHGFPTSEQRAKLLQYPSHRLSQQTGRFLSILAVSLSSSPLIFCL